MAQADLFSFLKAQVTGDLKFHHEFSGVHFRMSQCLFPTPDYGCGDYCSDGSRGDAGALFGL